MQGAFQYSDGLFHMKCVIALPQVRRIGPHVIFNSTISTFSFQSGTNSS